MDLYGMVKARCTLESHYCSWKMCGTVMFKKTYAHLLAIGLADTFNEIQHALLFIVTLCSCTEFCGTL